MSDLIDPGSTGPAASGLATALAIPAGTLMSAAALAALASWSAQAAGAHAYAHNTWRAYRASWAVFCKWAHARGLSVLPATPETVARFLQTESGAGRAVGTVKHRAATIAVYHRRAALADPTKAEAARLVLRGIAKARSAEQPRQAPALCQRDADVIVYELRKAEAAAHRPRPKDLRDVALMLTGRDLLARASELVSITVESITWQDNGTALVALHRRKTDDLQTCLLGSDAVDALQRWLAAADIRSGPVFIGLTKGGKATGRVFKGEPRRVRALNVREVGRILRALGERIGKREYSGHSLRVGMAVDLVADNIELGAIMQAGNWNTPAMVARYTRCLSIERGAIAKYHSRRHVVAHPRCSAAAEAKPSPCSRGKVPR
jgi:site-specific recombinase XerD